MYILCNVIVIVSTQNVSLFPYSKVQHVIGELLLNPDTICVDLDLCSLEPRALSSVQNLHNLFQNIMQRLHAVQSSITSRANRMRTDTSFIADFSSDPSSNYVFTTDKSFYSTKTFSSKKPKSGRTTFVQISDIHLDELYAEVRSQQLSMFAIHHVCYLMEHISGVPHRMWALFLLQILVQRDGMRIDVQQ